MLLFLKKNKPWRSRISEKKANSNVAIWNIWKLKNYSPTPKPSYSHPFVKRGYKWDKGLRIKGASESKNRG